MECQIDISFGFPQHGQNLKLILVEKYKLTALPKHYYYDI